MLLGIQLRRKGNFALLRVLVLASALLVTGGMILLLAY